MYPFSFPPYAPYSPFAPFPATPPNYPPHFAAPGYPGWGANGYPGPMPGVASSPHSWWGAPAPAAAQPHGSPGVDGNAVAWAEAITRSLRELWVPPVRGAADFVSTPMPTPDATSMPAWLEGIDAALQQQIAFLESLRQRLRGAEHGPGSAAQLRVTGRHSDEEVIAVFRVHNPTAVATPLDIIVGEFMGKNGLVPAEVCAIPTTSSRLQPGETREVELRIKPRFFPEVGAYVGRVTIQSPKPRHLAVQVEITP